MKLIRAVTDKFLKIGSAVMIQHTLFSLPLAVAAFLMESRGRPSGMKVLWILLSVFGARNGANALNRIIDRHIDKDNPRTASRDLPSGRLKPLELWIFTIICLGLFLFAAWKLSPLCLALVPVALVLIFGYSYTKRFTFLCHYWLGITTSSAVMGSFLALQGSFELRFFPLTAGAALWVAGFDIIYALQDIEHDRIVGIYSVPAVFGRRGGLLIAGITHMGALVFWSMNYWFYPVGLWYAIGLIASAGLLSAQHLIAWKGGLKWIPLASYHLNQLLSPLFMFFIVLDIFLPGGMYGGQ